MERGARTHEMKGNERGEEEEREEDEEEDK